MKIRSHRFAALTGALGLVSTVVSAAEPLATAPVVVTATRTAQTVDDSLASVTVITREEIERSQARSVDELLRTRAGIHISRNGGYGKSTNIYLRGTNGDHVLVLVDGVRAASATLGSYAWANLMPEQIERIEIVRGPRASLYGSDAIGGVIQIFTRKTSKLHARAGIGSNRLWEIEAGGGVEYEGWTLGITAGRLDDGGIPTLRTDTIDYGYRNTHLALNADGTLPGGVRTAFRLSQQKGRNELDPSTGDITFTNRVASLALSQDVTDRWSQRLTLGYALDRSTSQSPTTPSTITTRRRQLAWQHDLILGPGLLTAGFDHWIDHATKDRSGTIDRRIRTNAVFLQWQQESGIGDWQAAIRHDRNSASGNKTTWNAAWGQDLSATTRLTLSHGTAFKAPTVNDLYWPYSVSTFFGITYITQGNPNLAPESSRTTELELRHQFGHTLSLTANAYYTKVRDLIDWASTQTGPTEYTYQPINRAKVRIRGLELALEGRHGDWRSRFTFNLTDAKDENGRQLDRRPLRSAALTLSHPLARGDAEMEILAASERSDRNGAARLGGYALVNLRLSQRLAGSVDLLFRVENLFDKAYTLASSFSGDYSTLGRTLYLSLRWQP